MNHAATGAGAAAQTRGVVLFGVGSPLVVEYVEILRRLGWPVVAAVRNRDGDVHFDDPARLVDPRGVTPALRAHPCLCPMFTPAHRAVATREATAIGLVFATALVDPHVITSPTTSVGAASFINAGCVIGAATAIAPHVVINRAAAIGHHVRIGLCASVGPGAIIAGEVEIGPGAMIGAGAVLLPRIKIGAFAVIGAGAVVTRDVPARAKVLGNPARVVESDLPVFELPAADARGS